ETYESYNTKTYESTSTSYLIVCDKDGQQAFKTNITEGLPEGSYFWANLIVPSAEDTLFVMNYEMIIEVDMNGTVVGQIETSDVTRDMYQVLFYKDGYPVIGVWNEDWTEQKFCSVGIRKGEVVEELTLPGNFDNYNVFEGGNSGYDLILTNQTGVYGFNVGDTEFTLVMDYINSDLATYSVRNVTFVDSEKFIATYNDIINYDNFVALFTHVAPENVPDRETLLLATYGTDNNRTQAVINFNQNNEKYRITVKDYSQYSTNEDWYAGITQLNNDIISGNIPDIISCSEQLPIANYVDKGILVDFYELMDEDETINREDYCENVFKAYEIGGKLYELPTSFYIWTVNGKRSIFGDKTSLTWDEMDAYLAQYEGSTAFSEMTKNDVLNNALRFSYSQLVDAETGECHFNSDMFKSILEFANTYPETINWEERYNEPDYWTNYETQYIDNRTLLSQSTIYTVYDAWMNGYYNFAEPTTPVGYPNDYGVGSTVSAIYSYAISAKSPYQDGAWEFVKSFITPENQIEDERYDYWGLPILKEALEDSAKYIMEKPYYIDQDGNKVEQEFTIWVKNEEMVIEPADEQEKQRWIDFILSVETKGSSDYQDALEIISEDAAGYFSGDKTVEAVMEVIQSRMNIFISEGR
ncbi:MAG: extracellular solute-binding protein, partial [Lachnospiraceae bacterium]|nr:extracellular solute-binding protein [Lachnospiraceae bacterium]